MKGVCHPPSPSLLPWKYSPVCNDMCIRVCVRVRVRVRMRVRCFI